MYDFSDLKLNDHIETCSNPKGYLLKKNIFLLLMTGLCSINNEPENSIILAYPDKAPGQVSLCFYKVSKDSSSKETTITIKAHNSVLSCIELDNRGLKLATASEKVCLPEKKNIHQFLGNCYQDFQCS